MGPTAELSGFVWGLMKNVWTRLRCWLRSCVNVVKNICKEICIAHFKWVNFIACKLSLKMLQSETQKQSARIQNAVCILKICISIYSVHFVDYLIVTLCFHSGITHF